MSVDRRQRRTYRYQQARAKFLAENPLCLLCDDQGIVTAAAELDHVIPVRDAPNRFWDRTNWQPVCRSCHEEKTAGENRQGEPPKGQLDWLEFAAQRIV